MGLKIPAYTIHRTDNNDPTFYELLGPFLSKREVVAELGSPVWDDEGKQWLIAATADNEVLGFAAVNTDTVQSFYVVPDARGEAIGAALLAAIIREWTGTLKATATPTSVTMFSVYGFEPRGERGRYTLMEREAS